MDAMASSTKIEREREFHNKTFGEGSRKSIDAFYAVVHDSRLCYEGFLLEHCQQRSVLEYGCGPGSYSFFLAQHGGRVTGIDISDVAIEQAAARARREQLDITYQRMDAEQLTLPDNSFDLVCGVAILHHLDLDKAFGQLARTLKPGGSAAFFEPLGHNPAINLYRRLTPSMRTEDEHPLLMRDLEMAGRYFGQVETRFFTMSSLAATPFRKTRMFRPLLGMLEGIDRTIFTLMPFMRRYAWQVVITLSHPLKPGRPDRG
jgi:SAM-dependent methyltransferase